MSSSEKVVVRLTQDTIAILETLVDSGEYNSISEIIMSALSDFIGSKFTSNDIRQILEALPEKKDVGMEALMNNGNRTEMDEAVRSAVIEYVRDKMNEQTK